MRTLYLARHVLPVATRPIEDGALLVRDGRIEAVGRRADLLGAAGVASGGAAGGAPAVRDLGDAAILPGLVNAHTHVEWSWLADEPPPAGDAIAWIRAMIAARERAEPERVARAAKAALAAVRARGTVALGDVANDLAVGPLLAASGLAGVLFHELIGFRPQDAEGLLARAADALDALEADPGWSAAARAGRWRVALAPHAPHTVSGPLLRALGGRSKAGEAPLSIHVAETAEEVRFLRAGDGPLAGLLRERGRCRRTGSRRASRPSPGCTSWG